MKNPFRNNPTLRGNAAIGGVVLSASLFAALILQNMSVTMRSPDPISIESHTVANCAGFNAAGAPVGTSVVSHGVAWTKTEDGVWSNGLEVATDQEIQNGVDSGQIECPSCGFSSVSAPPGTAIEVYEKIYVKQNDGTWFWFHEGQSETITNAQMQDLMDVGHATCLARDSGGSSDSKKCQYDAYSAPDGWRVLIDGYWYVKEYDKWVRVPPGVTWGLPGLQQWLNQHPGVCPQPPLPVI